MQCNPIRRAQCILPYFLPACKFFRISVSVNQLLQEDSVTWDLSHSINIVRLGPYTISSRVTNLHVTLPTLQQLIKVTKIVAYVTKFLSMIPYMHGRNFFVNVNRFFPEQ